MTGSILKMKPQLKDLQQSFKSHLMTGSNQIADHIVSTSGLANEMRLAIYGNAYYARLAEALQQDYEAIHVLLGDEEFNLLCKRYIDRYPSRFASLRWFGQFMNEFLACTEPYKNHPYLEEMAVFEWCFIEAFDARDLPVASVDDVAGIAPEQWPEITIELHPSVHLFEYHWNILPVWKAATRNKPLPELVALDKAQYCLIWRQALMTQYRTVDSRELAFIKGVLEGENFSQLCERLAQEDLEPEQVPLHAAGLLKTWLEQGVVARLVTA